MRDLKQSQGYFQDTRKIRKILNEEVRLGIKANSDSETEEVDLSKELYPLSHYINNREEMIEQMFTIIKGAKLKKMLPPILKDLPLDEIKADCLIHLLGMSTKRILSILEGKEINSSSESETHSDSSTSPSKKSKIAVKPIVIKQEGCSDISDNSEEVVLVDPDWEMTNNSASSKGKRSVDGSGKSKRHHKVKQKKKRKIADGNKTPEKTTSMNVNTNSKRSSDVIENKSSFESSSDDENDTEPSAPTEGKTLLEILELEMRARAIRALLQKGSTPNGEESENIEEQPSQSTTNQTDTQIRSLKESKTIEGKKITPVRNFRKKKRKNDDVIVITPKVVTIDLTDETDTCNTKSKTTTEPPHKSPKVTHNSDEGGPSTLCIGRKEQGNICPQSDKESHEESNQDDQQKAEQSKRNWAQRWLESKEVKKVVSTSKICGNIRKRIKNAKLAKKSQENSPKVSTEQQEIQGSVNEYQLLSKTSSEASTTLDTVQSTQQQIETDLQPSVEQVQDITSTKSETVTEKGLVVSTDTENSVTESKSEPDEITVFNEDVPKNNRDVINKTNTEQHEFCQSNKITKSEESEPVLNLQGDDTISNKKISELQPKHDIYKITKMDNTNNSIMDSCESELFVNANTECNSANTNDTFGSSSNNESDELQLYNKTNQPKVKLDELKDQCTEATSTQSVENPTKKTLDSILKDRMTVVTSPLLETEPEALEINITDEDLEMDGMMEDKLEIDQIIVNDSTNKNSEIIEIK